MSLRIRKNDQVIVLKGREKGKKGRVMRLAGTRAYLEGINLVKKFARKTRKNPQGGQIQEEASLQLANLALFCGQCSKGVRFRVNTLGDGTKTRICAECQNVLGQ